MTGPKPQGPTHPTPTGPPRSPARQSNRLQISGSPLAGGPAPIVPALLRQDPPDPKPIPNPHPYPPPFAA